MGITLVRILRALGIMDEPSFLISAGIEVVIVALIVAYIAKNNGKDFDTYFKNTAIVMIVIEILWWIIIS